MLSVTNRRKQQHNAKRVGTAAVPLTKMLRERVELLHGDKRYHSFVAAVFRDVNRAGARR